MGNDRKKNINTQTSGQPDEDQELAASGLNCGALSEPISEFINADCETVYEGANNSYIVLGRDRPGSLNKGYGGKGHAGAGSIDLVVGRPGGEEERVHPNFEKDSARIHISQKTDIDDNFALDVTSKATQSSGIGIKADGVRVIARDSIKLVTNTDTDGEVKTGVEIIANNNSSTLQPMVKGDNLEEAMNNIVKRLDQLSGIMTTFAKAQMSFNAVAGLHIHNSPFYGTPKTLPSTELANQATNNLRVLGEQVIGDIAKFKGELAKLQTTYLNKTTKDKYINSESNKVN